MPYTEFSLLWDKLRIIDDPCGAYSSAFSSAFDIG